MKRIGRYIVVHDPEYAPEPMAPHYRPREWAVRKSGRLCGWLPSEEEAVRAASRWEGEADADPEDVQREKAWGM